MTASTYTGNGWKLVVETDQIEVTSNSPRADPDWRYTDEAGHVHFFDDITHGYPTLVSVTEEPYWCADCEDEHEDSHLECPHCMEVIAPGMTGPSIFREFIPGPTHVRIELPDGQQLPVTPEEWAAIRNAGPNAESFVHAIVSREANRG